MSEPDARRLERPTKDLDLCPAWSESNLERLASARKDLETRLRIGEGSIETLHVELDAKSIARFEVGTWRTIAGDVDVLLGIPHESPWKLARYDHLIDDASALDISGRRVLVASLEDIIRSKEIADRARYRAARTPREQPTARQPGACAGGARLRP